MQLTSFDVLIFGLKGAIVFCNGSLLLRKAAENMQLTSFDVLIAMQIGIYMFDMRKLNCI